MLLVNTSNQHLLQDIQLILKLGQVLKPNFHVNTLFDLSRPGLDANCCLVPDLRVRFGKNGDTVPLPCCHRRRVLALSGGVH